MKSKFFTIDFLGRRPRWEIFEKILLILVLLDLALGGNGYLVKIGPFRLREVLFGFCMVWAALRLTRVNPVRLDRTLVYVSLLFVAVTIFGATFGYLHAHRIGAIIAELKALSYFAMLPFFLVAIRTRADLTLTAGILTVCGTLLAAAYLLLLLSAATGVIGDQTIYDFLQVSDEFIFRSGAQFVGFLYKGAFYICVAALFLIFDPFKVTKILAGIAMVAIAMTLTRGLCLAVIASLLASIVLSPNWKRLPLLLLQSALMLTVLFLAQRAEQKLLSEAPAPRKIAQSIGERSSQTIGQAGPGNSLAQSVERSTDSLRVNDIKYIINEMDLSMLTVGRGLGAPIRGRDRIEMNYFEILYKQGILGLSVWVFLLAYLLKLYLAVPTETKEFGLAFFLSGLFVFFATATNTFLTGSIGMAVVFISLAGLLVLAREERRPMERSDWYGSRLGAYLALKPNCSPSEHHT